MSDKPKLNPNNFTGRTAYFFKCPHCGVLEYTFCNPEDGTEDSVMCMSCFESTEINRK